MQPIDIATAPDRWHALRAKNIGGSEVAALFDCQADYQASRFALYHQKRGAVERPDPGAQQRLVWGRRLEDVIARGLAEDQGWTIERGGYVQHPTVKGMGCTLDYIITGGHPRVERDGPGVFEIKAVDWLIHRRTWTADEPPLHITLQGQHECACTGYRWGVIGALIGGNQPATPYEFDARPKIIAEIESRVAAFWQAVERGNEPPVDGARTTSETLSALFPEAEPGKTIDVSGSNEFPMRVAALKQARLDKRAAEAVETANENWIMHAIGDAEIVRSDGMEILTAKTIKRRGYTVEPSSYRTIRLKESV